MGTMTAILKMLRSLTGYAVNSKYRPAAPTDLTRKQPCPKPTKKRKGKGKKSKAHRERPRLRQVLDKTKPEVPIVVRNDVAAAEGSPQVPGIDGKGTPAHSATVAITPIGPLPSLTVGRGSIVRPMPTVLGPFIDITVHVIQAKNRWQGNCQRALYSSNGHFPGPASNNKSLYHSWPVHDWPHCPNCI